MYPHVMLKLRRKIADTVGLGSEATIPSTSQIESLSYISLVLKEGIEPNCLIFSTQMSGCIRPWLIHASSSSSIPFRPGEFTSSDKDKHFAGR